MQKSVRKSGENEEDEAGNKRNRQSGGKGTRGHEPVTAKPRAQKDP